MDTTYTNYNMDGWYVRFPQEWKFSLDKNQQPIQIIFEAGEAVTIYISTWNWGNAETGELADAETISSFFLQAFAQRGVERLEDFSGYYPEGFTVCAGKSITEDGYSMISCAICTEGCALTAYFVFEQGVEIETYIKYIKTIERE